MSGNRPYHKLCYKEQHHPKCDVCHNFVSDFQLLLISIFQLYFTQNLFPGYTKLNVYPKFNSSRFRQIQLVLLSIGHIPFGCKSIVLHMSVMELLGAAVASEWRLVVRYFILQIEKQIYESNFKIRCCLFLMVSA